MFDEANGQCDGTMPTNRALPSRTAARTPLQGMLVPFCPYQLVHARSVVRHAAVNPAIPSSSTKPLAASDWASKFARFNHADALHHIAELGHQDDSGIPNIVEIDVVVVA
jgi:hypothetical protein